MPGPMKLGQRLAVNSFTVVIELVQQKLPLEVNAIRDRKLLNSNPKVSKILLTAVD